MSIRELAQQIAGSQADLGVVGLRRLAQRFPRRLACGIYGISLLLGRWLGARLPQRLVRPALPVARPAERDRRRHRHPVLQAGAW